MELKHQVVSLELSKQLKEAGYKQEGIWEWIKYKDKPLQLLIIKRIMTQELRIIDFQYVAPTVAELGEALPKWNKTWKISKKSWKGSNIENTFYRSADTEADCRAKMYLHLNKKGLI